VVGWSMAVPLPLKDESPAGFEPATPVSEQFKIIHALHVATVLTSG
jgi:hypothetical protein